MMSSETMTIGSCLNPYTQLQFLSQHTGVVRRLLKLSKFRCVSVADDCQAIVWDIQNGRKWRTLAGHTRPITCMCLLDGATGSGSKLLTGASDKRICIWNTETGSCLKCLEDHGSISRSFVSLEGGALFCSGGEKLCLWTKDGRLLHMRGHTADEDIHQLLAVRSERIVAAADRELIVYCVLTRGPKRRLSLQDKLPHHRESVRSLVTINAKLFASGSLDGSIVVWNAETFVALRSFNCVDDYQGEDRLYRHSIQHMTTIEGNYIVSTVGSGFCVYDVNKGALLVEKLNAHYSKILHIEFVFSGRLLASCSEDGSVRLWGSAQALQLFLEEGGEEDGKREDGGLLESRKRKDGGFLGDQKREDGGFLEDQKREDGGFLEDQKREDRGFLEDKKREDGGFLEDQKREDGGFLEDQKREDGGFLEDQNREDGGFLEDQNREDEGFLEDQKREDGGFVEDKNREDGGLLEDQKREDRDFLEDQKKEYGGFLEDQKREDRDFLEDQKKEDGGFLEDQKKEDGGFLEDQNREDGRFLKEFLGLRSEDVDIDSGTESLPVEPQLLGECVGHSGAVQMCLDFGPEGMLSCGADGLILLWQDGVHCSLRRTLAVTQLLYGTDQC